MCVYILVQICANHGKICERECQQLNENVALTKAGVTRGVSTPRSVGATQLVYIEIPDETDLVYTLDIQPLYAATTPLSTEAMRMSVAFGKRW